MKARIALVLPVVAALAACGGALDPQLELQGTTPNTSKDADNRTARVKCPKCKTELEWGASRCPQDPKICDTQIRQARDEYNCMYCGSTGLCSACKNMEQAGGACYNCNGTGYRIYLGKTVDCPNCGGEAGDSKGKCPICKGSQQCDMCTGSGRIPASKVEELLGKSGAASEEGSGAADDAQNP